MSKKKIYVAMVTPFDQNESLDEKSVIRLCHHFISMHVDGIVVCGTTGEVSSLSYEERAQLLQLVKKTVGSKAEIWMGCGTNNTKETLRYCQQAKSIGVDGIMLITPYYVRPSQRGLYEHFASIAKQIDVPLMLYNVPKRTGVILEAKTAIQLSHEFPHITMLKQAYDDAEAITQILSQSTLKILCGDDLIYDKALTQGVDGIVTVAGQVDSSLLHLLHEAHQIGIMPSQIVQKWKQLSRMCFLISSPSDVKEILSQMGLCQNVVRLPLVGLHEEEKSCIKKWLGDNQ